MGWLTSKDLVLFAGGTSNLYEYVLNDSVNMFDPDGLQPLQISQDSTYNSLSDSFYGSSWEWRLLILSVNICSLSETTPKAEETWQEYFATAFPPLTLGLSTVYY